MHNQKTSSVWVSNPVAFPVGQYFVRRQWADLTLLDIRSDESRTQRLMHGKYNICTSMPAHVLIGVRMEVIGDEKLVIWVWNKL